MTVVIHHNPDCGTSRNVLAIIEAAGYQPIVIEYLKDWLDHPAVAGLVRRCRSHAAYGAPHHKITRQRYEPARPGRQ